MPTFYDWLRLVFTLVTPCVIFWSVYTARRHFRLERTVRFWERFNAPNLVELRKVIDARIPNEDLANVDPEFRVQLLTFANFFTELGIAHENGLVDQGESVKMWHTIVPEYWAKLKPFISQERDQGRKIAKPFERLAQAVSSQTQSE